MTKNKKLVSRMMFALLVLTLVSFCFVGFTFARYTSGGNGTATATIAKWSITGNAAGGTTVSVDMGKISPDKNAYSGDAYVEANARKNESTPALVFTITNASDVDASVTLELGTITIAKADGAPATVTDAMVLSHLKIELCDSNGNAITGAQKLNATGGETTELKVYVKITWTSDISNTVYGTKADEEDTLIGQYVKGLDVNISYTAVQDSQIPDPAA